jgi:hypothetical protein
MALLKKQTRLAAEVCVQSDTTRKWSKRKGRSDAGAGGEAKEASQIPRQITKAYSQESKFEIRPDSSRDGAS